MQLLTWESKNAPASYRWVGKFLSTAERPQEDGSTITVQGLEPIYFYGRTEQQVIDKSETWWAQGEEKRKRKEQLRQERREAAKKRAKAKEKDNG